MVLCEALLSGGLEKAKTAQQHGGGGFLRQFTHRATSVNEEFCAHRPMFWGFNGPLQGNETGQICPLYPQFSLILQNQILLLGDKVKK